MNDDDQRKQESYMPTFAIRFTADAGQKSEDAWAQCSLWIDRNATREHEPPRWPGTKGGAKESIIQQQPEPSIGLERDQLQTPDC